MPEKELRTIGVLSAALISTILWAIWILIIGGVLTVINLYFISTPAAWMTGKATFVFAGLGAVFGFIVGGISALIYNFVTRWVRGIKVEVE